MNASSALSAGFSDPVHESQRAFRGALQALSRPGNRVTIGAGIPGVALPGALAHLLLTLTDDDTPVWWQQADIQLIQWLRFHTSASLAATPRSAQFAVLTAPAALPPLDSFCIADAASPETGATLLIELPSLDHGPAMEWRGPGIRDSRIVRLAGLPDAFWAQRQAQQALFPQGLDIIFCCGDTVLGLPRSTRLRGLGGH